MRKPEPVRTKILGEYGVFDPSLQPEFDDIIELAKEICDTPIVMLNFSDDKTVWSSACIGIDFKERPRDGSLCQLCIEHGESIEVEDLRKDVRFQNNPSVTEGKCVFYAGIPIKTSEGFTLGTLCLLDFRPRKLNDTQRRSLRTLTHQVMNSLELSQAKKASEKKKSFKNILENLKEVVFITDTEGKWTYLSPSWKEIFGHDGETSLGKNFLEFVHPDDRAENLEKFLPLLKREKDYCRHQVRYLDANGSTVWVEVFARPILSPDGNIIGASGTITDISLKKAEFEKFFEEKSILDLITNNLADVVWMSDPKKQKIIYISPSYDRLWGRDRQKLQEEPLDFIVPIHPEDRERVLAAFPKQVLGTYAEIYRLVDEEGNIRWIEDRAYPIKDDKGIVYRVVGIASDITEKILVEKKIREQNELFEKIVNNIPIFLTVYDEKGLKWFNKSAYEFSGWSYEEASKKDLIAEFYPDPEYRKNVLEFMANADSSRWEVFQTTKKNGEVIPTSWLNVRLSSGDCIGIGQDISLQLEQEKLIREQQMKIVAAAKMSSLGEMAAGVAHEINNPLTIISGHVHLLKQMNNLGEVSHEEIDKFCDKADQTVLRISKIVNGLKNFARDGVHDSFTFSKVSSLVRDTLSFCEARFRNNNVDLKLDEFDDQVTIECRYVQISQVLLNLLNNAFDAVVKTEKSWVRIHFRQTEKDIFLEVEDSGPGIPKHIQDKIMQPFFTTKPVGTGTGLGLSLSSGIIESHHGKLFLDKNSPTTKFIIQIPKKQKM
jgi:PAS domain S-box-containing protein